jgi:hypothetical protein
MHKIELLADVRLARRVTSLRHPGAMFVKITKPTRRRAKADKIAIGARIDNPNSLIRVRQCSPAAQPRS